MSQLTWFENKAFYWPVFGGGESGIVLCRNYRNNYFCSYYLDVYVVLSKQWYCDLYLTLEGQYLDYTVPFAFVGLCLLYKFHFRCAWWVFVSLTGTKKQKSILCYSVVQVHNGFVYVLGNSLQARFHIKVEEIAK